MTTPTLTAAQLTEVERLAGLMFSAPEINAILGLAEVLSPDGNPLGPDSFELAMWRGRLREEALVRAGIFELAKAGSAPAQTLAVQIINQARVAAAGL